MGTCERRFLRVFSDKSSVNRHISRNFLRVNATSKHDDDKNTKI